MMLAMLAGTRGACLNENKEKWLRDIYGKVRR